MALPGVGDVEVRQIHGQSPRSGRRSFRVGSMVGIPPARQPEPVLGQFTRSGAPAFFRHFCAEGAGESSLAAETAAAGPFAAIAGASGLREPKFLGRLDLELV